MVILPVRTRAFEAGFQQSLLAGRWALNATYFNKMKPAAHEYRIVRPPNGEVRWIRSQGRVLREPGQPLRMLVVVEDITERKLSEAALLRTEKLAAVGRLASSIAHEINNPLESVTNLVYLAKANALDPKTQEYLSMAEQELRRASAITSQTLRFHRQSTRPAEVDCDDLIGGVLGIHQSRMNNAGVSVGIRTRSCRPIFCSDGEVRQVLSNLINNAIDAIEANERMLDHVMCLISSVSVVVPRPDCEEGRND